MPTCLLRLARGLAEALSAIHTAGVIHRDLTPGNVVLRDGDTDPVVIDFGLARIIDTESVVTAPRGFVGTATYLAPEVIGGGRVGPASDVFSWAGTLVFAATGRTPFHSDSTAPFRSHWESLPAAEQARKWEQVRPGTFDRIMDGVERAERHQNLLDWAEMALRFLGLLSGLSVVIVLALISKHIVDKGAPTQAVGIFGAGAASIIGAFLTTGRGSPDGRGRRFRGR
ncbi:protein kinase [Actinoallomurus sp. NPDC050550]|uniref:protein kinase domain-containing protein n=1 Tax=Actinoallomurus sp. NPDC050550 TaxID=3154937 RepID=UPI0033CE4ECE